MSSPPRQIPIALKLLGVLWALSAPYLIYSFYGAWVSLRWVSSEGSYLVRLYTFLGVAGIISLVVAVGMFRPRRFIWYLALLVCVGTGWWYVSELPQLLFSGEVRGLLVFFSYLALYGVTVVYLLLPFQRALFGIGQRPTIRSSELPPAGAAGSRSP